VAFPAKRNGRYVAQRNMTVVITGASAGVGRAVAHRFARAGARIGLIARDGEALDQVKAEVERIGGLAHCAPADVADWHALKRAAASIESQLGPIGVWVNNAMVTVFSPVAKISPEEFRRVTEVTYLGCVHGTMAALEHMRRRNAGTVVQVGSSLAYRGIPLQAAYCGAKHAIRGFTASLRSAQFDWARTHMPNQPRPVPPVVRPEVAANAIFRATHGSQREYWLGLSTVEVIMGNIFRPGDS
jgi:NAD(P)-dependent dehydrogenase (short-subunit alcohol dehydrogenase family)